MDPIIEALRKMGLFDVRGAKDIVYNLAAIMPMPHPADYSSSRKWDEAKHRWMGIVQQITLAIIYGKGGLDAIGGSNIMLSDAACALSSCIR